MLAIIELPEWQIILANIHKGYIVYRKELDNKTTNILVKEGFIELNGKDMISITNKGEVACEVCAKMYNLTHPVKYNGKKK